MYDDDEQYELTSGSASTTDNESEVSSLLYDLVGDATKIKFMLLDLNDNDLHELNKLVLAIKQIVSEFPEPAKPKKAIGFKKKNK